MESRSVESFRAASPSVGSRATRTKRRAARAVATFVRSADDTLGAGQGTSMSDAFLVKLAGLADITAQSRPDRYQPAVLE